MGLSAGQSLTLKWVVAAVSEPHERERRKWPVVPVPVSLRGYQRAWLRGDLLAGITVAAFLVPQVMAYAQVAGVPPVAGLWAALPALVIYAALGSSRSLSMGPESTTALMTAVAIGPLAAGSPERYAGLAASIALLVGVLSVCAGVARLGFVADLLSRPVLVGYLAGVGLIMIAGQLGRVTGVRVSGSSVAAELASFAAGSGWSLSAWQTRSGRTGSSPPCQARSKPTSNGPASTPLPTRGTACEPGRDGTEINGSLVRRRVPEMRGLWPCQHLRRGAVLVVGRAGTGRRCVVNDRSGT
jgi:Sulfate permease family